MGFLKIVRTQTHGEDWAFEGPGVVWCTTAQTSGTRTYVKNDSLRLKKNKLAYDFSTTPT